MVADLVAQRTAETVIIILVTFRLRIGLFLMKSFIKHVNGDDVNWQCDDVDATDFNLIIICTTFFTFLHFLLPNK